MSVQTLKRWRVEAQSRPAPERAWTAATRLKALLTTAAMSEEQKSAWRCEQGVIPKALAAEREAAMAGLEEP